MGFAIYALFMLIMAVWFLVVPFLMPFLMWLVMTGIFLLFVFIKGGQ